ncbi:hypothetical protein DAI22_03g207700 [Oryza sativa Japonica Group]|nr:hypothetical protein DAI22_03g207700 [Oryza sativa Japonica Group]
MFAVLRRLHVLVHHHPFHRRLRRHARREHRRDGLHHRLHALQPRPHRLHHRQHDQPCRPRHQPHQEILKVLEMNTEYFAPGEDIILQNEAPVDFYI